MVVRPRWLVLFLLFALCLISPAAHAEEPPLAPVEEDITGQKEGAPTGEESLARVWPTVQSGNTGENVITIQASLRHRGYTVNYNGTFDSSTVNAVRSFQAANGLTVDGIVGAATWEKLAVLRQQGHSGIVVEALQRQLRNRYGYTGLTVDSSFGPGTKDAVQCFQSSRSLGADGIVGLDTWAKLTSGSGDPKLCHREAARRLNAAGISISSSGNCSDRNNSSCTSLDMVRVNAISGTIAFKQASGCAVTVTGGTEVGHSSGTYSHYNGYKIDISLSSCVTNYIQNNYTYIGVRGDGAAQYRDASGNIYAKESNHWDNLYY